MIVGVLCLWIAWVACSLHVLSNPQRQADFTIPEYVRRGFIMVAMMLLWKGVNAFSLVDDFPPNAPGHMNAEGVMAFAALAYLGGSGLLWAVRTRFGAEAFRSMLPGARRRATEKADRAQ